MVSNHLLDFVENQRPHWKCPMQIMADNLIWGKKLWNEWHKLQYFVSTKILDLNFERFEGEQSRQLGRVLL